MGGSTWYGHMDRFMSDIVLFEVALPRLSTSLDQHSYKTVKNLGKSMGDASHFRLRKVTRESAGGICLKEQ